MACRAAIETIRVLQDEKLVENAAAQGEYLLSRLGGLAERYPDVIADVRGKGLIAGVEMAEEKFGGSVIMEMSKRKVIAVYTLNKPKVIRMEPPLIIQKSDVDFCINALDESLEITRKRFL
jgi:putrescine aminotransferase